MLQESPDNYVFIFIYGTLGNYINEFSKSKYRKFHKSRESLPDTYASLWYLRSFPYKEYFNRKITLVHAMGIIKGIEPRFHVGRTTLKWDKYHAPKEEVGLIGLEHLYSGLMLLWAGYVVASVVLGAEMVAAKVDKVLTDRKERKARKEKAKGKLFFFLTLSAVRR